MLRIVTPVCTRSLGWVSRSFICVQLTKWWIGKKLRNLIARFFTIENNSRAEVQCCLRAAYGEENVMNLRNVQCWQSTLQEGRTIIYSNIWEHFKLYLVSFWEGVKLLLRLPLMWIPMIPYIILPEKWSYVNFNRRFVFFIPKNSQLHPLWNCQIIIILKTTLRIEYFIVH